LSGIKDVGSVKLWEFVSKVSGHYIRNCGRFAPSKWWKVGGMLAL